MEVMAIKRDEADKWFSNVVRLNRQMACEKCGKEGGYPAEYTRNTPTLTAVAMISEKKSHSSGYLNPDWVEWLMGVPTGWTNLGSWETE